MNSVNLAPNVIMIPANPEFAKSNAVRRQLRVAAYCRVSTDSEEQLTSYEAQPSSPSGEPPPPEASERGTLIASSAPE